MRNIIRPPLFHIAISQDAWGNIGTIPLESFNRIRERLRALANEASDSEMAPPPRGARYERMSLEEAGYVITFEIDPGNRSLTVHRISRKG
ncbi:MAG TPA: hypothetical protein VK447_12775 [Myxococcaceae bacterium]|nr:hypothetical protein [Myxococcaceae bacterium]